MCGGVECRDRLWCVVVWYGVVYGDVECGGGGGRECVECGDGLW